MRHQPLMVTDPYSRFRMVPTATLKRHFKDKGLRFRAENLGLELGFRL